MATQIKVCLRGFIALIFSIYGYKTCEKAIFNFNQTDQCFKNVTYELSPLFDAHSIMIVDSQVKAAHGLITFEEYCKNIKEAKETIKKHLYGYKDGNDKLVSDLTNIIKNNYSKIVVIFTRFN